MAYIGTKPTIGNFQICDAISVVNGQAAYTMQVGSVNVIPQSANHMIVSLNGTIQKPNSSFTVSGSTITFASNLVTNDVIDFIQILGDVLDIGVPSDSVVTTAKLADSAVTAAKITDATITNAKTNFVSTSSAAGLQIKGDGTTDGTLQLNCSQNSHGIKIKSPPHSASASYTLTMPNNDGDANQFLQTNGSGVLSFASAGGTNTPAFEAYSASDQAVSSDQTTKIVFGTEAYDSDGKFASSRFTPTVAGKYYIYSSVQTRTGLNGFQYAEMFIYKNGSSYKTIMKDNRENFAGYYNNVEIDAIMDLDDNDYVEIYVTLSYVVNFQNAAGYKSSVKSTYFGGYKLIT